MGSELLISKVTLEKQLIICNKEVKFVQGSVCPPKKLSYLGCKRAGACSIKQDQIPDLFKNADECNMFNIVWFGHASMIGYVISFNTIYDIPFSKFCTQHFIIWPELKEKKAVTSKDSSIDFKNHRKLQ